jgi:hypothetical protein
MGALVLTKALRFGLRTAIGAPPLACIEPVRRVSVREPREFPHASTRPILRVRISDELMEFYAFVFCQGGFRQLDMTFEQFLLVAAAIKPLETPASIEGSVRRGDLQWLDPNLNAPR